MAYIHTSAKVAILNPEPLTPKETREKCAIFFGKVIGNK
jgi:hypothetical protein